MKVTCIGVGSTHDADQLSLDLNPIFGMMNTKFNLQSVLQSPLCSYINIR